MSTGKRWRRNALFSIIILFFSFDLRPFAIAHIGFGAAAPRSRRCNFGAAFEITLAGKVKVEAAAATLIEWEM